ncbi:MULTISPECIES: FAD-dependent thymidylate synthase [unclassified Campylobacter]|uniref:FAD-dependent thymidylate synthase n=1 Tax=unclassified Campylobacter TaxID=2593542 RepID=UPI0022E9C24C|nr:MULTISPECIES: FAD-dependent thymidylate synthase [unclassified Campylobacter]MDA3042580.1 FAD-dependent thymidylate synthase [Campylobacter sp. JMF_09 ED2]MDA3044606.1 FAD-dependent thymidylate synthase [Campylobacter sp. JMF_07 ED4]MDA3063271.1 FAD-dependent thymidylate synthase [Campylobacter sp. JMF_11 EL3]MDA3071583.1 FAD-dependent thymidylate synthase [Campylobacter sp. VBCF_03 NA9]MDA3074353.1 FAD-dependent thymidylate synthase [Campylobacter sp. JMF_05 ED3]
MEVKLLNFTPLWVCSNAIRTCWQSFERGDNGGEKDLALINRVGNEMKHSSTLEHIFYNFYIKGISRALLQELARHRMASLSVKSTRYTLKELRNEPEITSDSAAKYIVLTGNEAVDSASIKALNNLREILGANTSLDIAKYCLPECYKTELAWSINARSLQNFLSLRSSKSALWEIRALANALFAALPEEHKFIFEHCMYKANQQES